MGNLQGFQIAPPQSADPLETLARMSQLRTQGLQQQQANLQVQQQQLQLASNKAIMQAMAEGGGDLEGTMNAMKNHPNILPQDWLGIQQHAMQYATQQAALTKDKLGIQNEQHEQWASLLKAKPVDSQDALNSVIRQGVARGLPVPQEFLDQQGNVMPYTGDPQHYVAMANGLQLLPQLSKQNLEEMQAGEASGKQIESLAGAGKAQVETAFTQHKLDLLNSLLKDPTALDRLADVQVPPNQYPYANRALKNQLRVTVDPDKISDIFQHYSQNPADLEKQLAAIPIGAAAAGANIRATEPVRVGGAIQEQAGIANLALGGAPTTPGLTGPEPIIRPGQAPSAAPAAPATADVLGQLSAPSQLHGEAWLNSLNLPPGVADQIRSINSGRATIESIGRTPAARGALQRAAYQYDPTWNEQRYQFRNAYTGAAPEATNIGNMNTAAVHAEQFLQAADAMKGGYFTPKNAVFNWFKRTFGSATPTNLDGIKAAWAGEMASALKGNATDSEIANVEKAIHDTNSWEQFKGIVNENLKTLGAKMNTKYEQAQSIGINDWNPIMPSAREVFQKHGMDPTRGTQGHQVGDYVMYQGKRHKITAIDPKTGKLTIDPNVTQ